MASRIIEKNAEEQGQFERNPSFSYTEKIMKGIKNDFLMPLVDSKTAC